MGRSLPDQIIERSKKEVEKKTVDLSPDNLVSSGSTLVNLACTDTPDGAYMLGGLVTIPGASTSGKTVSSLTCFATCAHQKRFDGYDLIYDDAEERNAFNIGNLFGERTENRMSQPPLGRSKTIQQFKANMLTLGSQKRKCIYVLDSLDSVSSDEELEKEMRKALAMAKSDEAAKKIAGSYNTEKAKIIGETLRMVNNYLKESKSLLIIVQQLRQNVGGGPFEAEYVTSGGEAPFFYSNHQLWMKRGKKIEKRELVIGTHARVNVVKNSATGKFRNVEYDIFNEFGIDDVGSCVDWMMYWEFWKKRTINKVSGIEAPELELFEPSRDALIAKIEEQRMTRRMRRAVGDAWLEVERSVRVNRTRRYDD